ncbi:MAG: YggS family pyridoxal phosphate-dependent enzyme [Rhodospirillales bacterium]
MSSDTQGRIATALAQVHDAVEAACLKADRPSDSLSLIAVSKTHPAEAVIAALEAGQRHFGENRVQEAASKFPALRPDWPDLQLHLIGPLQTNKAEEAVTLFDVIHTLDRPKLARALAKAMDKTGRRPACLIQVNSGAEPQKAGCLPDELEALYRLATEETGLEIKGLMCIPPVDEAPAPHFQFLRERARALDLPWLSMGMSGDYETAILLGATHVRVGTAIFGNRPPASATR